MQRDWWAPLTGIAFVVLAVLSTIVAGDPPDANDPVGEIVAHYADNEDTIFAGVALGTIAVVLLVFFAAILRETLRSTVAGGERSVFPTVAMAGAIIFAVGVAIDATIQVALADAADEIEPAAAQALQALWDNDYVPFALGTCLLMLGAGIAIVRTRALPAALGWIAIVIGVLAMTPAGFVAVLATGVWIAVVSVLLTLRRRSTPGEAQPVGVTR